MQNNVRIHIENIQMFFDSVGMCFERMRMHTGSIIIYLNYIKTKYTIAFCKYTCLF